MHSQEQQVFQMKLALEHQDFMPIMLQTGFHLPHLTTTKMLIVRTALHLMEINPGGMEHAGTVTTLDTTIDRIGLAQEEITTNTEQYTLNKFNHASKHRT
jgi:hypothetical protein